MLTKLHKVACWIVTLTIIMSCFKHTSLITSVSGQSTEQLPVSTEDSQVYCTAETDCNEFDNNNDTTNSTASESAYKFEPSSWCPPGYYLDDDVMLCSQKSCLMLSQQTMELLQETGEFVSISSETNNTDGKNLICVPVTLEYENCRKRPLKQNQYDVLENNASIHIPETNISFPLGQFVILQNGIASVCNKNETSNATMTVEDNELLTETSLNDMSSACMPFKVPSEEFEIAQNGTAHAFNYSIMFETHFYDANSSNSENLTNVCYELSSDFIKCANKGLRLREEFQLLPNISIKEPYRQKKVFPLGSYLFTKQEEFVVYCLPPVPARGYTETQRYLYGTASIISVLFLSIALLAHLFFPSLNYHAKALLCHIISMVFMYTMLAIQFFSLLNTWQVLPCYMFFITAYISILGTFFWPNILAFDLWRAFSDLRGRSGGSNKHKRRKFLYQCAYSWGIPILLCSFLMTIDNNKRLQRKLNLYSDITSGHNSCWFSTKKAIYIFFNGPIVCILLLNAFYFIMTVYNIRKASKGTDILNKKVSKQLFRVFAKLFIVTGIFWFAEVIAWFATLDKRWFYFTDTMNALQGVAIFLVYIGNKRTLKLIRKRLGYEATGTHSQVTLSLSSSSQGNSLKTTDTTQQPESKPSEHVEMTPVTTDNTFANGTRD